ncbi:hypothetical protein C1Y10_29235, partial [Pseudomonas sp. FW305-122]|uniref:hypothetical protein n=1 Tax=Pseudomonas sp. FW305-122 TaxID=2070561 RepID=UPI000CA78F5B
FHPITLEAPTRPLLFPLLTSFFNLLLGANDRNPFLLNFLLTGFFLYAASLWRGEKNWRFRFFAMLGVATSPVFSIHATSAGFDVCSVLFG